MLIFNYFVIKIFFDILNAKHIAITCTITPTIAAYMISSKKCHETKKPDKEITVIIIAIGTVILYANDENVSVFEGDLTGVIGLGVIIFGMGFGVLMTVSSVRFGIGDTKYEKMVIIDEEEYKKLKKLGFKNTRSVEEEIKLILQDLLKYKERIESKKDIMFKGIKWNKK